MGSRRKPCDPPATTAARGSASRRRLQPRQADAAERGQPAAAAEQAPPRCRRARDARTRAMRARRLLDVAVGLAARPGRLAFLAVQRPQISVKTPGSRRRPQKTAAFRSTPYPRSGAARDNPPVTPRSLLANLALLLRALVVSFLLAEAGVRLLTPYGPSLLVAIRGGQALPAGFASRIHPEVRLRVDVRFDARLRRPTAPRQAAQVKRVWRWWAARRWRPRGAGRRSPLAARGVAAGSEVG